jgi:hypothetical protein
VAVLALVAGGVVLATRSGPPTTPSPSTSIRAVALGDSVPYGHGLANPYLTPRIGLPATWVSQPPSTRAYPSRVARALGLTMTVRATNCRLNGDQLAVSGAVADAADNMARDGQCPIPPQQARNLSDELTAADLARQPARLVLLQDGADDIDFSRCLEYELVHALGVGIGTNCVVNGTVTPQVASELSNVRTSLAEAIERMAPHAGRIAVLDYYQPIPGPAQIVDDAAGSGFHTNLVCAGLKTDAAATDAAAQVVLTALNKAVAGAVADARAHHVTNVSLVDIATAFNGHGMCTRSPWVFSGEPLPDATLAADIERVLAATTCDATHSLVGAIPCASLAAKAHQAEQDLEGYVWRAAHPTAAGQRAIAAALEHHLRGRV